MSTIPKRELIKIIDLYNLSYKFSIENYGI